MMLECDKDLSVNAKESVNQQDTAEMKDIQIIRRVAAIAFFGFVGVTAFSSYLGFLSVAETMVTEKTFQLPGRLVQKSTEQTRYRPNYDFLSRSPNLRSNNFVLKTFEQAVGDAWKSTVQVLSSKQQVALGLVVDSNGWIVTKASQLVPEGLACRLSDGTRLPASIMNVNHDLDLALIKVNRSELTSVVWQTVPDVHVASWIATTSANRLPVGIGVVSVGPRKIPSTPVVLGVSLGAAKEGSLVSKVVQGGGAERAGIEEGDVILSIDGSFLGNTDALIKKVRSLRAGQRVSVGLTRNDHSISLIAQIMDLSQNLHDSTEMEVTGNVSARASGFSRAFQHDTVLAPHQCGGPVIDTHGRVVGLNIARAGRVTSYALPIDVLVPAVQEMMANVKSHPVAEEVKATVRN